MRNTIELQHIYQELLPMAKCVDGTQFYYKDTLIGEIVVAPLTMVDGCKFYNEDLKNYVPGFNASTAVVTYDADGNEIPPYFNLYTIDLTENIVKYTIAPLTPPASIKFLKYCGPDITKVLLSTGTVQMDEGYLPTEKQDVVTKSYADQVVDVSTSITYGIKNAKVESITENGKELLKGVWYQTGGTEDVILTKDVASSVSFGTVEVTSSPIVVQDINDSIVVRFVYTLNGKIYYRDLHKATVKDIIDRKTSVWSIASTTKPYTSVEFLSDEYKWAYCYRCTINAIDLDELCEGEIATVCFATLRNSSQSASKRVGVDAFYSKAYLSKNDYSFEYSEESIIKSLTKVISGKKYLGEGVENLSIDCSFTIKGRALPAFYSGTFASISANEHSYGFAPQSITGLRKGRDITINCTLTPAPADVIKISYKTFTLLGTPYIEGSLEIPVPIDLVSNEAQRMVGPSGETLFPEVSEFSPWNDGYVLQPYDMVQTNGKYESSAYDSVLTLRIEPAGHYSHVSIDADWDGTLYVMSEGYTEWLNGSKSYAGFGKPTTNGAPCKSNDHTLTFGKVVYDSPVYLRFIGSTQVKIRKVELN